MTDRPVSELFAALAFWVHASGVERLDTLPGLWTGETDEWKVRYNNHRHEIDSIAPLTFELAHKTAFIGLAFVQPYGGVIIAGPHAEDAMIDHFRAEAERLNRMRQIQ